MFIINPIDLFFLLRNVKLQNQIGEHEISSICVRTEFYISWFVYSGVSESEDEEEKDFLVLSLHGHMND